MQERAAAIAALIIAQVEKGRLAWSIPELDEAGLIGKSESYEAINTGRLLAVKRARSHCLPASAASYRSQEAEPVSRDRPPRATRRKRARRRDSTDLDAAPRTQGMRARQ
jgi:hypothetical protein